MLEMLVLGWTSLVMAQVGCVVCRVPTAASEGKQQLREAYVG